MFNETRHQIHVSSVKQDPTLDTVHVPVQGAVVVTGQQTLELSFEEWTGNGKDQSVG